MLPTRLPLILCSLLVLGAVAYLLVAGAPLTASSFFIVAAAVALGLVVSLAARAAVSLLREPEAEEVKLATGRRRKELEREKQLLLKAIKELEFDHEMGKISDADFNEIAARYRGRAIQVMRQLDENSADYRKLVERDVAERRRAQAAGAADAPSAVSTASAPKADAPKVDAQEAAAREAPTPAAAKDAAPATMSAPRSAPRSVTQMMELVVAQAVDEVVNQAVDPAATPTAVAAVPKAAAERWSCPQCHTSNDEDALFCKRCGRAVGKAEGA